MIYCHELQTPNDYEKIFAEFDPLTQTWVVADLNSTKFLQENLFKKYELVEENSVMRAQNLWRKMFFQLFPDWQIVSTDSIRLHIGRFLQSREEKWLQAIGTAKKTYDYLTQLISVVNHNDGDMALEAWIEANPDAKARWGHWAMLSFELWTYFKIEKLTTGEWLPACLASEIEMHQLWDRPLFFNLGAELSVSEADLLQQLGRMHDIHILKPTPTWDDRYEKTLLPYKNLFWNQKKKPRATEHPPLLAMPIKKKETKKFATPISEVKYATWCVRQWIEEGIKSHQIAILSPRIEDYWFVLQPHLEEEGIPTDKTVMTTLQAQPGFISWIAKLALKAGDLSFENLLLHEFEDSPQSGQFHFRQFSTLFQNLYDEKDLQRNPELQTRIQHQRWPKQYVPISREEFIELAFADLETLVFTSNSMTKKWAAMVLDQLHQEVPQQTTDTFDGWVKTVKVLCGRLEWPRIPATPGGVRIINSHFAENLPVTHSIYLGLTENSLNPIQSQNILSNDVFSLEKETGFLLPHPDRKKTEFQLKWQIEKKSIHTILCVPESDFSGQACAPSLFWLEEGQKDPPVTEPPMVLWDERQRQNLESLVIENDPKDKQLYIQALQIEKGVLAPSDFIQKFPVSLSCSSIKKYLDCPFIFAAEKILSLKDEIPLDLDLDPMARGSLLHALLDRLCEEPVRFERNEIEISLILDEVQKDIQFGDVKIWNQWRQRYLVTGLEFLKAEKAWRALHPLTRTIGREKKLQFFFNPETLTFTKNRVNDSDIMINGRIDRIDTDDQGHAIITDYKSSAGSIKGLETAIEENDFQLLLYPIAVELGAVEDIPPLQVVSACYCVAPTFERKHGFRLTDIEETPNLYPPKASSRNYFSTQQIENFKTSMREKIKTTVLEIRRGNFIPQPQDPDSCEQCHWKKQCRAPHLL